MRSYIPMFLLLVACGGAPTEAVVQPVKCVTAETFAYVCRDFAALSTADDAVTLAFKVAGRVVDVPVAKGRAVVRGELLARLDSRDVELDVEAARATYDEALSRLRRAQRLLEHGAISQQEVESIESSVAQSSSAYNYARGLLADMSITAPFDGVVERVYVDAFQRVAAGESVVRIVTPRSTTVSFTAPENLVKMLDSPTTHYSVMFDAWPDVSFNAVIKSFARTSSDALGFPVSLRLVDVDEALYNISPGMTCVVTVALPESDRSAVVVPLEAIYAPVGGGCYVWVVDDDVVQRRAVVLGSLAGGDGVVVLRGIEAGDRVVEAGVYRLYDGQRVRVIE